MRKLLLVSAFICFTAAGFNAYALDMPLGNKGLNTGSIVPGTFNMIMEMEPYFGVLQDNDGNAIKSGNGKNTQLNSFAAALAAEWHTNVEILGGTYSFALVVPAVSVWLKDINLGGGATGNFKISGLGDFWLEPCDISWKVTPQFDARFILGFNLPVGADGISFDHFSVAPGAALTYYFDAARTWSISAFPSFEIHSTNLDDSKTEGVDFLVKWGVGKSIGFNTFGIIGYSNMQITADSAGGVKADKRQVHAVGLQYNRYLASIGSVVALLVNQEIVAKNTSKGTRIHFAYIKIF